jgi:hypothetical protein
MKSALVAVLVLFLLSPAVAGAQPAPSPLSRDGSSVNLDSTYGSGHFGRWTVDQFGLPAYRYDMDETRDPRAQQPELAGSTVAQHQVGNDHIVAAAYNDGYTKLWSQDRLMQWVNRYDEANKHYAGGFGYLNVAGDIYSTLYTDRRPGAPFDRYFGVGYYRKRIVGRHVEVNEKTYAPFGDDPVLVDEVTIHNTTKDPKKVSWFEYWDVNPYDQGLTHNIALDAPVWDPSLRTLTVAQNAQPEGDSNPLSVFAASVGGPNDGFETSIAAFYGTGTRAMPAEVSADKLGGTIAMPRGTGAAGDTLFAFRAPVTLGPLQTVTLKYLYGAVHPERIPQLVAKYRSPAQTMAASSKQWSTWLPKADFGASRRWVARELAWDAYLLRSASVYEELCGHHTITQGGYYQYDNGANLGYRSWLHYALPITYTSPSLAREILRYSIGLQPFGPAVAQQNPYGVESLCTRFDLGTSNDLDFWLLLAAGEYGLGMRDTNFFTEQIPYYRSGITATAWEHVKEAFAHQETLLGPHGEYVMGTTGDWSDFSTEFVELTESTLVLAQLAYAYPKLADLADLLGDHAFAGQARAAGARNLATLRSEWTGGGWYSRGYSGARQVGSGVIMEEPQPWAILAGAPSASQTKTLVANIHRFLDGYGAPHGPSKFGTAMAPSRFDPGVTELGTVPLLLKVLGPGFDTQPNGSSLDSSAEWPGGSWFDLNGHLTWAYTSLDGTLNNARDLAWDEYTRNTLARHAALWPNHWAGTISVDDVCLSYYSTQPDKCGTGLSTAYDGQITEQPTWMVMNAIRLAGLTPTRAGYDIAPHFPFTPFSLRMSNFGISLQRGVMRGYIRAEGDGPVRLTVHLPFGVSALRANVWVDGHRVASRGIGTVVNFDARTRRGRALDWAITWTPV